MGPADPMEYKLFNNILELVKACPTEKALKDFLAYKRWKGKPKCIYCGHDNVWVIKAIPGRYECPRCKKDEAAKNHTFSVLQGTIFEGTHLSLETWFWDMFELCLGSNSSNSNAERFTISTKTSWRTDALLRHVVKGEEERILTATEVEIDEVELAAEPWKDVQRYAAKKSGRKTYEDKIKAFGIRERGNPQKASKRNGTPAIPGGYAVIIVIDDRNKETLIPILKKHVPNLETIVFHDGAPAYDKLNECYPNRQRLNKSDYERYQWQKHCRWIDKETGEEASWEDIRNDEKDIMMLTVNGIESCWMHLTLHFYTHFGFSRKHAQAYVNEYLFRFNRRHLTVAEKFEELLQLCLKTPVPHDLHKYELKGPKGKTKRRVAKKKKD